MSFIIDMENTSGEEGTVIPDGGFFYTDNLNVVNEGQFIFSGSGETRRSLIEMGSNVRVQRNGTLEFRGLVDDIEFFDGGAMAVHATGYEVWLAKENGDYAGSPWTATASATIFSAVLAEASQPSGAAWSAGTIEAGTSIDFRANVSDSLLNVIKNLRRKTAQDIGVDYPNLEIDILDHKGSLTSVETLNAGIQIGDVAISKSYPIGNKIKVYGQSEGQTRIQSDDAQGQDAGSQATYGVITFIIEDRTITTVAEANLLANAEVARLKDPRKIYNFDVFNPAKTWVSGDVLTINAPSQEVSAEEVRIVSLKRGIRGDEEFLEAEVTNKEFSEKTKTRDEVIAEIDKKNRDSASYDVFQNEYSNQTLNTFVRGVEFSTGGEGDFVDFNGANLIDVDFCEILGDMEVTGTADFFGTVSIEEGTLPVLCGGNESVALGFGSVDYIPLNGIHSPTGVNSVYVVVPRDGTLKNFRVFVGTNSLDDTTLITVYKNGSTTALTVSYNASATGLQSDTSNTVAVSAGDRIAVELDASTNESTSGSMDNIYVACELK